MARCSTSVWRSSLGSESGIRDCGAGICNYAVNHVEGKGVNGGELIRRGFFDVVYKEGGDWGGGGVEFEAELVF